VVRNLTASFCPPLEARRCYSFPSLNACTVFTLRQVHMRHGHMAAPKCVRTRGTWLEQHPSKSPLAPAVAYACRCAPRAEARHRNKSRRHADLHAAGVSLPACEPLIELSLHASDGRGRSHAQTRNLLRRAIPRGAALVPTPTAGSCGAARPSHAAHGSRRGSSRCESGPRSTGRRAASWAAGNSWPLNSRRMRHRWC
jgi:hypothetical protein